MKRFFGRRLAVCLTKSISTSPASKWLVSGSVFDPPQKRPHARQQFFGAEWLYEIIIRSRIQPSDAILNLPLAVRASDRTGLDIRLSSAHRL